MFIDLFSWRVSWVFSRKIISIENFTPGRKSPTGIEFCRMNRKKSFVRRRKSNKFIYFTSMAVTVSSTADKDILDLFSLSHRRKM